MIINDYHYAVKKTGNIMNLYCVGDIHMGSGAFLEDSFNKIIEISKKDKNAYFIFSGDITDDDRPSTRVMRRAMFNDRPEALQQEDIQHLAWMDGYVIPKIKKLIRNKERCLGILDGDHYRVYSNGMSSVQYICAKLKVPYLGTGQALIRMHFRYRAGTTRVIKLHTHYGDIRALKALSASWDDVDIFVRGHSHKPKIIPDTKHKATNANPPTVIARDRLLINTGSFRKGMIMNTVDYAESKVYPPTSTRCPVLVFNGYKPAGYDIAISGLLTEPL